MSKRDEELRAIQEALVLLGGDIAFGIQSPVPRKDVMRGLFGCTPAELGKLQEDLVALVPKGEFHPATVGAFFAHEVGRGIKYSTLRRRMSSLRFKMQEHCDAIHVGPERVRALLDDAGFNNWKVRPRRAG